MSLADALAARATKLKPTTTVVKTMLEVVGDGASRPEPPTSRSILLISRYSYPFEKWLAKSFIKIMLTSVEAGSKLPLGAVKGYTKIESFPDFTTNPAIETRALELHKQYKFDAVISISEEDILRAARIRELLGVGINSSSNGYHAQQSVASATRFRDKVIMKDTIAAFVKKHYRPPATTGSGGNATTATASTGTKTTHTDSKSTPTTATITKSDTASTAANSDEKYGQLLAHELTTTSPLLNSLAALGDPATPSVGQTVLTPDCIPVYTKVDHLLDVTTFLKTHGGYPVIIKPRRAHSSIGLMCLRSEKDLHDKFLPTLKQKPVDEANLDLEIEKFITGEMYHIDGVVINHELKVCWPSKYVYPTPTEQKAEKPSGETIPATGSSGGSDGVMNFSDNRFIAGCSTDPSDPLTRRLQVFMKDVLIALAGPANYSFHGEVWYCPDHNQGRGGGGEGRLVLCEVASRTGGGEIRGEVLELFGVNLNASVVQAQSGDYLTNLKVRESWTTRTPAVSHAVGWCFVYPKSNHKLVSYPDAKYWDQHSYVIGHTQYLEVGKVYSTKDCADAAISFLVKGATHSECVSNIRNIAAIADQVVVWEAQPPMAETILSDKH